ncbi:sulfatase [Halalkalibaculum sp. DA3122]|uniref:sulfatase family protein n=1 Tax=Halalkalibaculum sp. DA3122 TaxID=3373607 RepID=UPI003754AA19
MKYFSQSYLLIVVLLIGCSGSGEKEPADASQGHPNIVFIISDDQAWTDYSFMGHPHIETPNIDNLASEGLTFTRGYLPAPVCRPSLASLITGLYPHQHGVTGNDPAFEFDRESNSRTEWLQARKEVNDVVTNRFNELPSLTDYLSELGYLSLQTGKWWEGSWKDGGFTHGMTHGDPARGGRHGDEGLTIGREGMQPIEDFMDQAQQENKPFFLWYAPFMPHTPHTPPDSLLNKYLPDAPSEPIAKYWAMIDWFDITVGQLLGSIEDRGLEDNTLVVYVTDNGWVQNPETENQFIWPSKQSPYDDGIRTPITYKWPGEIPARMDTSTFVSSNDIAATVLDILDIEPERTLPGINVLDQEQLQAREAVYSEDFNHDIADVHEPTKSLEHRVVLKRPWKLIVPKEEGTSPEEELSGGGRFIDMIEEPELYHIVNDPHERNDVASEHPEIVRELTQRLNNWWSPEF